MNELDFEATEAARDLAAAHDIDISTIDGSGVNGKIIKSDVENVIPQEPESYITRGNFYICMLCPSRWGTEHLEKMNEHQRARH